ncbi:putative Ig domain-containing protein [Kribbella sp. NBC_00889]|uniref:putative Ig domain-containing protein n=1 Tax=Kribbella sp. NBC_00889 TaxID=2975974 RepID=UPI00386BD722|nr:putative Ig domain-containing protein [Kribbella sp. NBC_00889]
MRLHAGRSAIALIGALVTALLVGSGATAQAAGTEQPAVTDPAFAPQSIVWPTPTDGYLLGGDDCGTTPCPAEVKATHDGGKTWTTVGHTHNELARSGEPGITGLQFLDRKNGWAYDPYLENTTDGGRTWTKVAVPGDDARVVQFLASADGTYVVTSGCPIGSGVCDDRPLKVWRAPAGKSSGWQRIDVPVAAGDHTWLAANGSTVYLLASAGAGVAGRLTTLRQGTVRATGPVACADQEEATITGFTSNGADRVFVLCMAFYGQGHSVKTLMSSGDGGRTFRYDELPGDRGLADELTVAPDGAVMVPTITASQVYNRPALSKSWRLDTTWLENGGEVLHSLVFQNPTTAWMIEAQAIYGQQSRLWVTRDAGQTWQQAEAPGATTTKPATSKDVQEMPKVEASCDQKVAPGTFRCFAQRRTDLGFRSRSVTETPAGYSPADLAAAYRLPSSAGSGQRVYIVDAYDSPTAESDLAVYRRQYGLPPCTTANGCFQKLNQDGRPSPLPAPSRSWAGEISLDLDMVSAVCPQCGITLIEANSPTEDMLTAVKAAGDLGAKFVSLSWGGSEMGNLVDLDRKYFLPRGVVYAASTGDYDYDAGTSYPASSAATTAVGGTTLTKDDSARGWTETVWNSFPGFGTGSGCSAEVAKPSWQSVIPAAVCPKRAVADVSAVADPATGVAVYQTTGGEGWAVYGGTSAAAPIIAAMYALAGDPAPSSYPASYPYGRTGSLNDVVQGNNGECTPAPLCTAQAGWDGPTGLGTPIGTQALTSPTKSNRITVNAPTQQFSAVGDLVLLPVRASDPGHRLVRFSSTDLPAGLRLDATTGIIYGRPTQPQTHSVTVTATDSTGARGNTVINWVVSTRDGSRGVANGDFTAGTGGWSQTADVIRADGQYADAGLGYAWLGGYGTTHTDSLSQRITVPIIGRPSLRFALRVDSDDTSNHDVLRLTVDGHPVCTYTAAQSGPKYVGKSVDLTPYRGRTVTLQWTSTEDDAKATSFLVDGVSVSP